MTLKTYARPTDAPEPDVKASSIYEALDLMFPNDELYVIGNIEETETWIEYHIYDEDLNYFAFVIEFKYI